METNGKIFLIFFFSIFFFFFSAAAASLMRVRSPSRTRTGHWSTWLLSRANYYHWMQSDGPPQHRSVSSVPFFSSLSLRGELFLLFRVVSFSRRGQRLRFFPILTKQRWRSSRVVSCGTQLDTAGYCFYRQSSRLVAMLTAEVARASVFCGDPWNEIEKLFAVELPTDVLVYFFPPRALALDDGHKRWAISGRLWWRRRVWLCLQCKGMKETEVGLSLSLCSCSLVGGEINGEGALLSTTLVCTVWSCWPFFFFLFFYGFSSCLTGATRPIWFQWTTALRPEQIPAELSTVDFSFYFVDKCLFSCSIRDSYFRGPFLNKYMCALCVQCCSLLRQSPDRHVPAWLIPTFDLFAYPMPNTNSNCVRRCGLNPISFVIWILFVVCVVFFWFGTFLSFFRRSCRSVGSPCLFIYSFLLICNWKLKRKESPFLRDISFQSEYDGRFALLGIVGVCRFAEHSIFLIESEQFLLFETRTTMTTRSNRADDDKSPVHWNLFIN